MKLENPAMAWPVTRLRRTVADLLCWLEVPAPETTGAKGWIDVQLQTINHDFRSVLSELTDRQQRDKVDSLRVEANHLAHVLNTNPGIGLMHWQASELTKFKDELSEFEKTHDEIIAGSDAAMDNDAKPATDTKCKSYYPGELAKRIGCNSDTLATYAVDHAKLPKREIGEKDNPYAPDEVQQICEAFIRKSRIAKHKTKVREVLEGG